MKHRVAHKLEYDAELRDSRGLSIIHSRGQQHTHTLAVCVLSPSKKGGCILHLSALFARRDCHAAARSNHRGSAERRANARSSLIADDEMHIRATAVKIFRGLCAVRWQRSITKSAFNI